MPATEISYHETDDHWTHSTMASAIDSKMHYNAVGWNISLCVWRCCFLFWRYSISFDHQQAVPSAPATAMQWDAYQQNFSVLCCRFCRERQTPAMLVCILCIRCALNSTSIACYRSCCCYAACGMRQWKEIKFYIENQEPLLCQRRSALQLNSQFQFLQFSMCESITLVYKLCFYINICSFSI